MARKSTTYTPLAPSDELPDLLSEQAGVASMQQLADYRIDRRTVYHRIASGRWQTVHRGVVATFTGPLDEEGRLWAALLRCGEGATLSHRTAAYLYGFHDSYGSADDVDVMIPAPRRVRGSYPGIRVHHAHRLDQTRHPVRVPPIVRAEATVLDLVDVATTARQAAAWILAACQRRVTTSDRLAEHLVRRKKIRWRSMAEAMLVASRRGVQSLLEERYLRTVERAHGLPPAERQRRIAGERVIWIDVDYETYGVRVELDGRLGHEGDGAFRDRRRDNRGVAEGKSTLRYGAAEVFGDQCLVAAEVARVLRRHGWAGQIRSCGPSCGAAADDPVIIGTSTIPR